MAGVERRAALGEIRVEGRDLSGIVVTYGEISPSHNERFEPGSIRMAASVHLDLFHDPERAIAWMPGGGLELRDEDGALRLSAIVAPVPAGDRALAEVRDGAIAGLSIEFRAEKESRVEGVRVIEQCVLSGVGLVRSPSYTGSIVENRERARRIWL